MSHDTTINLGGRSSVPGITGQYPGVVVLCTEAPLTSDGIYSADELVVGRSVDCTICLEDPALSRRHAKLAFEGQTVVLSDLGSQNGTFLNGSPVRSLHEVSWSDVIRCGQTLLMVVQDVRVFAGWRSWTNDGPLIGGPSIRRLVSEINAFAIEELEVLIIGESGTGKELVASELHRCSKREGAFVPVNCAAVPHSLFEAEIFGARKGAYTDAAEREGLFSAARGGTLFLDEVGEISLELQAKLLRAVELKEVRPVGANRAVRIDVRVIAATNRDLQQATIEGSFRQDLYHRLRGFLISIPPLRQRIEDIVLFVEQRAKLPVSVGFIERLLLHSWPGNIRELDRTVQEAAARCRASSEDQLRKHHLHQDLLAPLPALDNEGAETARLLQQVKQALTESKGNVSRAAEALGMHRAQIYNLLRSHSINAADFR